MYDTNMNPKDLTEKDLPLIVFSDHSSGVVEFLIKFWTRGSYNHSMWMHRPGFFASQGNIYSEATVARYMKKGNRLKFVQVVGLTPVQSNLIIASINRKLKLPWWKKLYDWPGILLGQLTRIPQINIPGLNYCSEDVVVHLSCLIDFTTGDLNKALTNLPKHGSPQDLNDYFKNNPYAFQCVGKWEADDEIFPTNNDSIYG